MHKSPDPLCILTVFLVVLVFIIITGMIVPVLIPEWRAVL